MSQQTSAPRFESSSDIAVHVPDLERARAFYNGVMGFRLVHEQEDKLAFHTGVFTLWVDLDDKAMPYIPGYGVVSYNQAKEHLSANGCRILQEFPEHKALYFVDPFGIVAAIIEKNETPG